MTSVDIYMQIIGQYRPISYEEEQSYAERIQSGDDEAFKDFVVRNIRLVVKIAIAQRKDTGLDLDSLVAEVQTGSQEPVLVIRQVVHQRRDARGGLQDFEAGVVSAELHGR